MPPAHEMVLSLPTSVNNQEVPQGYPDLDNSALRFSSQESLGCVKLTAKTEQIGLLGANTQALLPHQGY